MSKSNPWKISTFLLAGALVLAVGGGFVSASTRGGEGPLEPQPHMKAALELLQKAHAQLGQATPDKGGHRVKAMELTKAAIEETKAGIAFDNKH